MSSDGAIVVENLGKCYHIYDKPRDRLIQMLSTGHRQYYREFWALRNVSFTIRKGETVGIVGKNGSGKSTLLQLICGTLTPTAGDVRINGRIAALLELGSGFNPEFTGRENVFLNAAVLGLSKRQTMDRFDAIAAFADIGDFIDQPVKTYSSGMQVRLAFSVAINVDPEILVVDEALSVGDELFQRKCYSRIESIRAQGATILFVSHSGSTVVDLCDRAILLDAGEHLASGTPKQIIGGYQKLLYAPPEKYETIRASIRRMHCESADSNPTPSSPSAAATDPQKKSIDIQETFDPGLVPSSTITYESHGAIIRAPEILTMSGERANNLLNGRFYRYTYTVNFEKSASCVRFGMLIKTLTGVELGGAASASSTQNGLTYIKAGSTYRVDFRFLCSLNPGVYFLNAGVVGDVEGTETYLHRLIDIAMFRVLPNSGSLSTGTVDFRAMPEYELVDS